MGSMIRNSDMRVRIPPAIIIMAQKCYGVKFYGSSVSGTRTGDAANLVAGVGDDSNAAVVNDFDKQPIYNQIHDIEELALDSTGATYKDPNGKDIANRFVYIPRFWMSYTIGTDSNGSYTWYQIANYPKEGFWPAFKNVDGSNAKFALVGKYKASYLSSNHTDIIGSVKGQMPVVNTSPSSGYSKMSFIKDSGLGFSSQKRLLHGRTWQVHNAIYFLMTVEFATKNMQAVMRGTADEGYYKVQDYNSDQLLDSPTNYISLPTSHYMVSQTEVGTKVCLWNNGGTTWESRIVIEKVADTDSNGAKSGYTRLTLSGDAFTIPTSGSTFFFHTWAVPAGITDAIRASSGICTSISDGNTGNSGHHAFKYRGIENPYGGLWEFVGDIAMKDVHDGVSNKCTLIRYKTGSTINSPETYSEDDGVEVPTTNGWQKIHQADGGCLVPTDVGASDVTYLCDYYWAAPRSTAGTSYFEALVGGSGTYGSRDGPLSLALDSGFGYSDYTFALRPCLLL